MKKRIKLNYYEVETITVCPYCGDTVQTDPHMGCCGEVHSEEVYQHENGETYQIDEVELYRPIRDIIRYSLNPFSPFVRYKTRSKLNRIKRRIKDSVRNWYDGHDSLILRLRIKTGFQWTKIDCFILKQIHDFPLYYTSPDERLKERRKQRDEYETAKALADSKGESLGWRQWPPYGFYENEPDGDKGPYTYTLIPEDER